MYDLYIIFKKTFKKHYFLVKIPIKTNSISIFD